MFAQSVDQVLDAMEYAVYAQDVEHIVLDNLQFMLGSPTKASSDFYGSKLDLQDVYVGAIMLPPPQKKTS